MAKDNYLGVDLATAFTKAEVAERIREYLGLPAAADVDAITNIVRAFFRLKDRDEREAALSALDAFFCRHCGSGYPPCYCMRDD